jgi:xylose isomerase
MFSYALITGFLSETKDRFHTYNAPIDLDEKCRQVASIPNYSGVELVYPYEVTSPEETAALVSSHNLQFAAINVNVKGEPEFVSGGLTSSDKEVREKAVRFIKEAKDFALAVGAPRVTCCPLGDGFEFVFQEDYRAAWTRLVDAFGEAADYRPEMPLMIEYKPKETRRHCYLNRAADTLVLIKEIGHQNLGITMDYGHSVYAGEHPAETLSMLHYSGQPYYIHINDNDRSWDWDFFTGSHTLLEYIEFMYYLKKYGYNDFLTSDTHPTRWSTTGMFEINARMSEKISTLLDRLTLKEIQKQIDQRDYMNTWRFIETKILGLADPE